MIQRTWAAALTLSAVALAQNPVQPSPPDPNSGTTNSGNSATPAPRRPRINPDNTDILGDSRRSTPESVSGRVVLSDGAEPEEQIRVQRVCGLAVVGESYADSKGRFSIQRANTNDISTDASSSRSATAGGCELRASLSGYQPGTLALGNRKLSDSSDVGVIVLHKVGAREAMTVSATSLLAPKSARKSYDQGLDAIHHNKPDQAQKDFLNAVRIYPRFAAAWCELGKVYEQRSHISQARDAYAKSIAADSLYLFSYERLYLLDVKESKWQEAADASSKVLRLDPYEFSRAYYFNAISNLELNKLDAAERSAREAVKLEGLQAEPRGNYVLGVILWRKGDLTGAAETLRVFLANSNASAEQASAQRMLVNIERQIAARAR